MRKNQSKSPFGLLPGDTVTVIAPSSPFRPDKFDRGLTIIRSMGFKVELPAGIFSANGFLAGDDHCRAEMVNNAFKSPESKAIICARGGYGSIRILDKLEYDVIRKNPKIFVGFSDVTSLLTTIYEKCKLVTFHGPTITSLADADVETINALFSMFSSGQVLTLCDSTAVSLRPGLAKGPVIGGNLTTLCHLVGTPFEPGFQNHILFLEDRGEAPYRIDRMLTQMKMAGCFEGLLGLILGSFSDCGALSDIFSIFDDCFSGLNIPILAGFKVGHEKSNMVLPIGLEATLNSDEKYLCYHMPSVILNSGKPGCRIKSGSFQNNSQKKLLTPEKGTCFGEIDNMMIEAAKRFVFPGAVLLFSQEGSIMFHKAYGISNIFSGSPVELDTIFDLASLTKPLATATSFMALVRDRKITLTDTLGQILPEFNQLELKKIQIGQLLSHTSGLPAYHPFFRVLEKYPPHKRETQLRQMLVNIPLQNPIGNTTLYSDLGFMILSWIIQRLADSRIDRFADDEVFKPLGLENLYYQDIFKKKKKAGYAATEICPWRKTLIEGLVHDENTFVLGGVGGHAGLFGTAQDIHRLLNHLLTIYNDELFQGLFPSYVVKSFLKKRKGFARVMGFDTPSEKNSSSGHLFSQDSVGHLGFTGTSFWMDLKRSVIIILLTNRIHPDRNNEKLKKFRPTLHNIIMENILKAS